MMLMLIRNFKCKLEKSLTTVPSVSKDFWAQTLNEFWIKEIKKILNNVLNFIMSFMKHESFLKYSDCFLKDYYYYCHWNIESQNLDEKTDYQIKTQFF